MIALTGTPEDIRAAANEYRAVYSKNGEGEDYLVDHSTFSYMVMPEVGFVDFFRRELTPGELADKMACFVENA